MIRLLVTVVVAFNMFASLCGLVYYSIKIIQRRNISRNISSLIYSSFYFLNFWLNIGMLVGFNVPTFCGSSFTEQEITAIVKITQFSNLVGILSLTDILPLWEKLQQKGHSSINKIPKHMKKTFELYTDPVRQIRKKCPLTISGGGSISCIGPKCMWFVKGRCVFMNLVKA